MPLGLVLRTSRVRGVRVMLPLSSETLLGHEVMRCREPPIHVQSMLHVDLNHVACAAPAC